MKNEWLRSRGHPKLRHFGDLKSTQVNEKTNKGDVQGGVQQTRKTHSNHHNFSTAHGP